MNDDYMDDSELVFIKPVKVMDPRSYKTIDNEVKRS